MPILALAVDQYFYHISTALGGNCRYWNVTATCMALLPLDVPTEEMQESLVKVAQLK